MQGERASLGFLSEVLNFEHGSSNSSNGVMENWENIHGVGDNDLQDYMIANSESNNSHASSAYREQHDVHRLNHGEASSSGTKNEASSHNEQRRESVYFEERRSDMIDLDPYFGQPSGANQPSVQNVNLNAEYVELHEGNNPVRDRSGFFEPNGPGTRVTQPGRFFEDNSARAGSSSVEGLRASCKRKALEASIGQSSGGYQDGESSSWTPASAVYRPGNGANISGSLDHGSRGLVSGTAPKFPVSAVAESSSRNTFVRSNPSDHQETVNPAAFSAGSVVRRPVAPPQSNLSRHIPADPHPLDLRYGPPLGNVFSRIPNSPALGIPPPVSRNMLPPFQWTEGSLAGGPLNTTAPVERNLHLDENRSRSASGNILENPMFIPVPELGNLARSQSSRNLTNGNLNIASSLSRTGSPTGVQQQSSNPAWSPYQNLPHYQRRRSELVRRSLMSSLAVDGTNQRSGDHPTLHSFAPSASPDGLVLQPGGDNSQMHNQAYSRAGPYFDRQGDSVVGVPHSLRALAATRRGRSRLMLSQMQNVLEVMRRDPNNNLRLEDVMLLNQSVLYDGASRIHDQYRDMRLDVDNMSYEELLALEERIGDVCTGLNEETITNRLRQREYKSNTKSAQDAAEPCCVCQEEYNEGEEMGILECGHEFHNQCIKEWLKQKNICPICKTTGLNTAKKRKIG